MNTKGHCPQCRTPERAPRETNPDFPFCSKRCKLLDLGAWASGKYAIPGHPAESGETLQKPEPRDPDSELDDFSDRELN